MVVASLSYAIAAYVKIFRGTIDSIIKEERWIHTESEKGFNPKALNFDLKFGFSPKPLTPEIGYWTAEYVEWGHNEDGALLDKVKTNHTMYQCGKNGDETSQWGNYAHSDDFNKFWCSDVFNNTLKGSFSDTSYKYM